MQACCRTRTVVLRAFAKGQTVRLCRESDRYRAITLHSRSEARHYDRHCFPAATFRPPLTIGKSREKQTLLYNTPALRSHAGRANTRFFW